MMKTTININGLPLLNVNECTEYFSYDGLFGSDFFFKPNFRFLPLSDTSDLNAFDDAVNKLSIPDGIYLIGLGVISKEWIDMGFCNHVYRNMGLIINYAYPMSRSGGSLSEDPFINISFTHAMYQGYDLDMKAINQ